jgi:diguanylate cyclase (GGDEF)-like protein
MALDHEYRRVLLVGSQPTLQLFHRAGLTTWKVVTATSTAEAALLLESNGCDVTLMDERTLREEGITALAWLTPSEAPPVVLLADVAPTVAAETYARGVSLWLPLSEVCQCPALLARALERVVHWHDLQNRHGHTRETLDACQRQVDRLVGLLWRTAPLHVEKRWYTHRHMLERLEEELARAERHQLPLSVGLGQLRSESGQQLDLADPAWLDWTADSVTRGKRRGDIAGQYGLSSFMLLMSHTPAAGGVSCCRRLQTQLEHLGVGRPDPRQQIRAFFGVASCTGRGQTAQALLRRAEEYLEAARQGGSERVVAR